MKSRNMTYIDWWSSSSDESDDADYITYSMRVNSVGGKQIIIIIMRCEDRKSDKWGEKEFWDLINFFFLKKNSNFVIQNLKKKFYKKKKTKTPTRHTRQLAVASLASQKTLICYSDICLLHRVPKQHLEVKTQPKRKLFFALYFDTFVLICFDLIGILFNLVLFDFYLV